MRRACTYLWLYAPLAVACIQDGRRQSEDIAPDTSPPAETWVDDVTVSETSPDTAVLDDTTPDTGVALDTSPDSETLNDTAPDSETLNDTAPDSETSNDTAPDSETVIADTDTAETSAPPPCGSKGMTWEATQTVASGALLVECSGCDAFIGDTCCREELPVLCFLPGTAPKPADVVVAPTHRQWSGGTVKLTHAVRGDSFASRAEVDALCATRFGAGWRVAEFHDGTGWGFWAFGTIPTDVRMWVDINDQSSNCWSWSCVAARKGDGPCDCGCKVQDPDCGATSGPDECDRCYYCPTRAGPQVQGTCDAIDASDTRECLVARDGWTCAAEIDGDGTCDCGCGVRDTDCATTNHSECERDTCPLGLDPTNATRCMPEPDAWTCNTAWLGDGACDCGCGAKDVDCASSSDLAECEYCEACGGSCAAVDPNDTTRCLP